MAVHLLQLLLSLLLICNEGRRNRRRKTEKKKEEEQQTAAAKTAAKTGRDIHKDSKQQRHTHTHKDRESSGGCVEQHNKEVETEKSR